MDNKNIKDVKALRLELRDRIEYLNKAAKAYYTDGVEIISNYEYDKLYDELVKLEEESGIVMSNSPTRNVGYEILESLPKEAHPSKMLSLDKTKSVDQLGSFLGDKVGVLSWKLDGLTVVLTYEDGSLVKAVTRGNGEIGEVVTSNAKTFANIPLAIPFKGKLVLRGEAFITYSDFERINASIPMMEAKYKNPRNLCSGSVRQLNSQVTAERSVSFNGFSIASIDGDGAEEIVASSFENSRLKQLRWLESQGFEVVEHLEVTRENIKDAVADFEGRIATNDKPSDGLVLQYDDIEYGVSLGTTAKFPRDAIAFKWADEIAETSLLEIEWSPSRTGLINPVAIFEPVDLEGTTVSRASVHNVSILKSLELGIGDRITVYKANMIIPQIAENLTRSGNVEIPEVCPVCGGATRVSAENDVEVLICENPDCPAKKIKAFTLFVSRDGMNIESLSESTLEKFIEAGVIHDFSDLFHLEDHKDKLVNLSGFGEKSYNNLIGNVNKARETTAARVVYSLGIPGIGAANAKVIAAAFDDDVLAIMDATIDQLTAIDGIGDIMAEAFVLYMKDEGNRAVIGKILDQVNIIKEEKIASDIEGKVFVITGSLVHFDNRKALTAEIEKRGGKVTGSVSAKTDFLVNNDRESGSSKNKKAKELGIPIVSEEEVIGILGL